MMNEILNSVRADITKTYVVICDEMTGEIGMPLQEIPITEQIKLAKKLIRNCFKFSKEDIKERVKIYTNCATMEAILIEYLNKLIKQNS